MQLAEKHAPTAAELLLIDLEQRQDRVLEELDALDRRICEVLESIVPGCTKVKRGKKENAEAEVPEPEFAHED